MKRSVIMMAFLALFCLGATAQTLPEGAYRQTEEYRSVRMNPLGNSTFCKVCGNSNSDLSKHSPYHIVPGTPLKDRYLVGNVIGEDGIVDVLDYFYETDSACRCQAK